MSGWPDSQFVHSASRFVTSHTRSVSFHYTVSGIFCRDAPTASSYTVHPVSLLPIPVAVPDILLGIEMPSSSVDRCHSLRSLLLPPAALPSLPARYRFIVRYRVFFVGMPRQPVHAQCVGIIIFSVPLRGGFLFSLVGEGLDPPETVAIGSTTLVTDQLRERQDAPIHLSFPHLGSLSPTPTFFLQFHIISLMI